MGNAVGAKVGESVGVAVGGSVGVAVGDLVGAAVGDSVGTRHIKNPRRLLIEPSVCHVICVPCET